MALPEPVPGLVIGYSYLWYREHLAGSEEGRKDRPCSIVATLRTDENGAIRVLVLPITHSKPDPSRSQPSSNIVSNSMKQDRGSC